ncbi:hypothetical protein BFX40_02440 [Mesorhizobium sp. SEMIA 3007]|nr:hypothetical protein BFX40_02440 [Mesorhizobium sp. SEMIA 3007]
MAKKLRRRGVEKGIELKLTAAKHAMARVYGYRNWMELVSTLNTSPPSPWDSYIDLDEVLLRKNYQVKALAYKLGIEEITAAELIAELQPTEANAGSMRPQVTPFQPSAVTVVTKTRRRAPSKSDSTIRIFDFVAIASQPSDPNSSWEE